MASPGGSGLLCNTCQAPGAGEEQRPDRGQGPNKCVRVAGKWGCMAKADWDGGTYVVRQLSSYRAEVLQLLIEFIFSELQSTAQHLLGSAEHDAYAPRHIPRLRHWLHAVQPCFAIPDVL